MLRKIMTAIATVTVAFATILPQPMAAQSATRVRIENNTDYTIVAVYLSPTNEDSWGQDLLGRGQVLQSGYYAILPWLYLGHYDLKLVDQDLDACIVPNVSVTSDTSWAIDNSWLLNCEFRRR